MNTYVSSAARRDLEIGYLAEAWKMALAVALAGSAIASQNAAAEKEAKRDSGLSVSGRVFDDQARPIRGATVYVYSAGVRQGSSPYCPTCYPDCGKRVTTDAEGGFSFEGLDAELVFRLLAVAEGHRPAFTDKVDPRQKTAVEVTLAVRPIPFDSTRVVRGQVIDPQGQPAVGAVVSAFGCKTAQRRWWGRMDGVDPRAVTDADGKFALVCDAPVIGLDLQVEARNAVRKKFELVPSGPEIQRLQLEAGATVTGRVVDNGRPLPGVSMGFCQVDRGATTFLGDYEIGTDEQGQFILANLPTDELYIYGIMQRFSPGLAFPVRKFEPAAKGTTDLGDLSPVPSCTLAGRLVLADGKPVPPDTRVIVGRDKAWDSVIVSAAADGSFSVSGVPPEVISITAQPPGYRLSPKNLSFEPLNGFSIQGLVTGNLSDLIILFEPGERISRDDHRDWQAVIERHRRLDTQRLAGVTLSLEAFPAAEAELLHGVAKPKPLPKIEVPPRREVANLSAEGPKITLAGTVVDHAGRKLNQGTVWMPVRWLSPLESVIVTADLDAEGAYRLSFPEACLFQNNPYPFPTAWSYAPGHGIGSANSYRQVKGGEPEAPLDIKLPASEDLSFVVLLPDGQPAVGARVRPCHFRSGMGYDLLPPALAELVAGTTDAQGRVVLPALTREGMYNVDVLLAGFGTQRFRCELGPKDLSQQTIRLRGTARVEGRIVTDQLELTRYMYVSINTTENGQDRSAEGVAVVRVDDQGRFVVPEIAEGTLSVFTRCDERLPVRVKLPDRATRLLAGETRQIELSFAMARPLRGRILAKDTQLPLSGLVAHVSYGVGRQSDQVVTDERGEFVTHVLPGKVHVQVTSVPDGYMHPPFPWPRHDVPEGESEFSWPVIEVEPADSIEGTVIDHTGKPLGRARIQGVSGNRSIGGGTSNADGQFRLVIPRATKVEWFEVMVDSHLLTGQIVTREPLIVRADTRPIDRP